MRMNMEVIRRPPPCTELSPAGHAIEYAIEEPPKAAALVVFIMGLGNHRTLFERQRQHFAGTYAILSVDLRGVGSSASPPGIWRMADFATDILHVIDRAAPRWRSSAIHLVGHSMGGQICYEVAHLAPPGRVASVAMISSVGCAFHRCSRPVLTLRPGGIWRTISLLLACDVRDMLDANLRVNYPDAWLSSSPAFDGHEGTNSDACIRFLMHVVRGRRAVPPMTWVKQVLALLLYRASPPPVKGSPRMLVVAGSEDSLVAPTAARDTAMALGARFVLLEGVGHNSMVQAADRVNEALESHLAGPDGASSSPPHGRGDSYPPVHDAAAAVRPMGSELW